MRGPLEVGISEKVACAASLLQLAVWSSGMILASGARGPGFNSQNSPLRRGGSSVSQ